MIWNNHRETLYPMHVYYVVILFWKYRLRYKVTLKNYVFCKLLTTQQFTKDDDKDSNLLPDHTNKYVYNLYFLIMYVQYGITVI